MKSVKQIVLDGLKYFRQALLSDTPVENDTTHALSLAGAYSLQTQINSLSSKVVNQINQSALSHFTISSQQGGFNQYGKVGNLVGFIALDGSMDSTSGATIYTLPSGYRPLVYARTNISQYANNTHGYISIDGNGNVFLYTATTARCMIHLLYILRN